MGQKCQRAVVWAAKLGARYWNEAWEHVLSPTRCLLEEMVQTARKEAPKDLPQLATTPVTAILVLLQMWQKVQGALTSLSYTLRLQLSVSWSVEWWMRLWWQCVVGVWWGWWWCMVGVWWVWWWCVMGVWWVCQWVYMVVGSPEMILVVEAMVEAYWVLRALVSLPRLVLTEVFKAWGAAPLTGWVGRRGSSVQRQKGVAVAWSDPVPLSTARGVKGATGATLSEVLLTASTGAIRDYLRVTGLTVPEQVRCSLSVYSPRRECNATSALRQLRLSMETIRRYPERYLASMWLLTHVAYILPRPLLGPACRALAATCPVLLSNLAGPHQPEVLWGHEILDVLYWRPPHDGAVLSVCVTSYRGSAVLGVAGDVRIAPGATTLPQAFITHLNELAVETGVRL
ncbi:hypothetical protein Pmani_025427 [Petrolisthes manimaculis]|uniref:O-acyltransferase WSD1 C-terminal domain-containing protein n=1 Tax=Petrolisthes manimaculis TaxID=1843537 RepID=A0AAE1P664_9EUCA|nr:hypothetical protein Pmani_025427 [Petrolisthes manimaculis]